MIILRSILCLAPVLIVLTLACHHAAHAQQDDAEAEYTRAIEERAAKIVAPLAPSDDLHAERIKQLVAGQYRSLRELHDSVDQQLADLDSTPSSEAEKETQKTLIQLGKEMDQLRLHRKFVAELSVELSADQIEQVKDGMTYGVVPNTYRVYLEMYPGLKPAEKKQILALLLEAREYAMDAGSSEEKHDWFRKYKGRINNNLSAAGY